MLEIIGYLILIGTTISLIRFLWYWLSKSQENKALALVYLATAFFFYSYYS